jgi:hypothetical protein
MPKSSPLTVTENGVYSPKDYKKEVLSWDGNTEGLLTVNIEWTEYGNPRSATAYKVSDIVPTIDDFSNGFCMKLWDYQYEKEVIVRTTPDRYDREHIICGDVITGTQLNERAFYIIPYDGYYFTGPVYQEEAYFPEKGIYFSRTSEDEHSIMRELVLAGFNFDGEIDAYSSVTVDTSSRLSEATITKNGVYDAKNCRTLLYDDAISFKYDLSDIDIDKFYNETEHNYGEQIRYGYFMTYPSSSSVYVYVRPGSDYDYKHLHLLVEAYSTRVRYVYLWQPEPEYGINEPGWYNVDFSSFQAKKKIEKAEAPYYLKVVACDLANLINEGSPCAQFFDLGIDGLSKVNVNIQPKILPREITKNGTYEAGVSDTLIWDGELEGNDYIDFG